MTTLKTSKEFIEDARKIHGDKFDYSKVKYKSNKSRVLIGCKIHGFYLQLPTNHLRGAECKKCTAIERTEKIRIALSLRFLERSPNIHGNKYDYSKVQYVNNSTQVKIICPAHGVFLQMPHNHLNGKGCDDCANILRGLHIRNTQVEFIEKSSIIHNNKYDYSEANYTLNKNKITIGCPIHGWFYQTAAGHLSGKGCKKCAGILTGNANRKSVDEFESNAIKIHGDKYDYSFVEYERENIKVNIKCHIHGIFSQTPNSHLQGHGCRRCHNSKGESKIEGFLINKRIKYHAEYMFSDCINPKTGYKLRFDFYIPSKSICIEFDGMYHYPPGDSRGPTSIYHSEQGYDGNKYRDGIKNQYCKDNGLDLIRIPFFEMKQWLNENSKLSKTQFLAKYKSIP